MYHVFIGFLATSKWP